jgi:hypothetical protein
MADCGQHAIEQLPSAADEWLAGDVLTRKAGLPASRPMLRKTFGCTFSITERR